MAYTVGEEVIVPDGRIGTIEELIPVNADGMYDGHPHIGTGYTMARVDMGNGVWLTCPTVELVSVE